jgi:hypothetical protein
VNLLRPQEALPAGDHRAPAGRPRWASRPRRGRPPARPSFDFEEEYRESTEPPPPEREKTPRLVDALPERPARIENLDGDPISLRALDSHLLEFNHPDERVRLNAIAAIRHYLRTGLPERLFSQVDMLLSLAQNDSSLRVRKVSFETYQLVQQKDYCLVREPEK